MQNSIYFIHSKSFAKNDEDAFSKAFCLPDLSRSTQNILLAGSISFF